MEHDYDVIIIGGGHNGLTSAARLAREGVRTLVLEARSDLGGMASTAELLPGVRVDLAADDIGLYRSDLLDELGLGDYGLELVESPAFASVPATADHPAFTLWHDPRRTVAELERVSKADARRFGGFLVAIERLGAELEGLLRRPPRLEDLAALARTPELMRTLTGSAAEVVGEWFESEALRGALSAIAVAGVGYGPRAAGTGWLLLYQLAGTTALGLRPLRWVRGGVVGLSRALAAAAAAHGADVRCNARVAKIITREGRAEGVRLEDGRELTSRLVLSSLDARRTLLDLVGADRLRLRTTRQLLATKYRGVTSRLVVELDGALPELDGIPPAALAGRLLRAPRVDFVERAADCAKYGRWSEQPVLEIRAPVAAGALVGGDRGLLTIHAQCAPYQLRGASWDQQRPFFEDAILDGLEVAWPGVRAQVRATRLLLPGDWESELGATEGSATHGEMSLAQSLVLRSPGGGESEIADLVLCGAGAHPGGGVTGLPGTLASWRALELLGASR